MFWWTVRQLRASEKARRQRALELLAKRRDPRTVDAGIQLLKHSESTLGPGAIELLGRLRDSRAIGPLVTLLADDPSVPLQARVHLALSQIDAGWRESAEASAAVPKLLSSLEQPTGTERACAVLGELKDARSVLPLWRLARKEGYQGEEALRALQRFDWSREELFRAILPELTAAVRSERDGLRTYAARLLEGIPHPSAVPLLLLALSDAADEVRRCAARGLLQHDRSWARTEEASRAVPMLSKSLLNFSHVRSAEGNEAVAEVLSLIGTSDAKEAFVASVERGCATPYLEGAQEPWVRRRLVAALSSNSVSARRAAERALEQLPREPADDHERLHRAIGRGDWPAVIELGPAALDELLGLLENPSFNPQPQIIEILGRIGGARAIPALLAVLERFLSSHRRWATDPHYYAIEKADRAQRLAAVRALSDLPHPQAIPTLVAAMGEFDGTVGQAAGSALLRIDDESAESALVHELQKLSHDVESQLAGGGESALAALEAALASEDSRRTIRLGILQAAAELPDQVTIYYEVHGDDEGERRVECKAARQAALEELARRNP